MSTSTSSTRTTASSVSTSTVADPLYFCIEWNADNQLTRVTKNAVEQARFKYDPRGRRVEKTAGAVTATWVYDGDDMLRESRGATTLKYSLGPAIDEPFAVDDGTSTSYFHQDALGSVVKTTTAAGGLLVARRFDAWGNVEVGAATGGYAFTGREQDPELGLAYYRARYYDPKSGTFVAVDPLRFGGGVNFYPYAMGNPVIFKDPLGLKVLVCNRYANLGLPYLNHSYMWDTRTRRYGGHRNCGRGNQSGQETGPGTPGTTCLEVPDSTGREDELMRCCERTANDGAFIIGWVNLDGQPSWWTGLTNQSINDCHSSIYRCLFASGLTSPPHPRIGCRDCRGRYEYPNEYGGQSK
jgi:RHS repeat-associated protein